MTFFRRGSNFYVTNKLKSEIFNKISLQTKMFFADITYNLNWDILTKNLVILKDSMQLRMKKFKFRLT